MLRELRPNLLQSLQTLRRVSRILWVRVALITALSVLAALSAEPLDQVIPDGPKDRFSQSATLPILTILANGMLAVATFSLGVMVSSHRTSAEQATPRIHRLLMEDTTTQSMLATFIGAFVFSLCAIILFRAGYYSESAAVIVFAATIFVVSAIVVSLVRWIGQLTQIGSLEYALDRAERAAGETLHDMRKNPCLGGVCWRGGEPKEAGFATFTAGRSGFLCRVDMRKLQSLADDCGGTIYLDVQTGDQILQGGRLGWTSGSVSEGELSECFVLEASRSVDQDPRYALAILRETASKALSPGINDQGTAVEVIARLERLLWNASNATAGTEPLYPAIYVPMLIPGTLAIQAFRILARDGAAHTEVLISLAQAIQRVSARTEVLPPKTAEMLLQDIHDHGMAALRTEREKKRLNDALQKAGEGAGNVPVDRGHLCQSVNERLKLTRFQRLKLTHPMWRKAPRRAALT